MDAAAKVTSKGQVTVPKAVRDALAFLGAGPVEDYLGSDRFDRARTERACGASDRLRRALSFAR